MQAVTHPFGIRRRSSGFAPLPLLVLGALSGCASRQECPPVAPVIVRPMVPADLLVPPPTPQDWDRLMDQALSPLISPGSIR